MAYENLVGLYVSDETKYQQYRDNMIPILKTYGGSFRYDFKVGETLKSEFGDHLNRVFVISFSDQESKENFFNDEEYKKVRSKYFDKAVDTAVRISEYEVD